MKKGVYQPIKLDEWGGPRKDFMLYSHSTGAVNTENFPKVVDEGMRIAKTGMGSLAITFLEEDPRDLKELRRSLRRRIRGDHYNKGSGIILASVDPKLQVARGIEGRTLEVAKEIGRDPLGVIAVENVHLLTRYQEEHRWRENAWAMPGRFILAFYDGRTDTVHLNPGFTGEEATEYGREMERNLEEYQRLEVDKPKIRPIETCMVEPTKDDEVW